MTDDQLLKFSANLLQCPVNDPLCNTIIDAEKAKSFIGGYRQYLMNRYGVVHSVAEEKFYGAHKITEPAAHLPKNA